MNDGEESDPDSVAVVGRVRANEIGVRVNTLNEGEA